ncbi:unnamed protein product [Orchesella dallaii]|uniref:Uncharacterized protein n=2 Tax=Orchesella dallaii TaxID=48710 RepID=A0ABP1QDA6_9HEXA
MYENENLKQSVARTDNLISLTTSEKHIFTSLSQVECISLHLTMSYLSTVVFVVWLVNDKNSNMTAVIVIFCHKILSVRLLFLPNKRTMGETFDNTLINILY